MMKKFFSYLLIFTLIYTLLLTSCRKENVDENRGDQFETLKSYMSENNMDISDLYGSETDGTFWVLPGTSLGIDSSDYSVSDYYVIDLRSTEDFNKGHIKDAHNTTLANILDEAKNSTKSKILVVCFSGQTAARGVAALRLAGYSQSFCLQWGMCGWNEEFNNKWESNVGDLPSDNWSFELEPELLTFNYPEIITEATDGETILNNRIHKFLTSDWTIENAEVLESPFSYYILNKWSSADWAELGHIAGAYRYDVDNGLSIAGLDKIDPSTTMVFYCYNGQTSAFTTFWLQLIGYENARSLLFGTNAIIHTDLLDGSNSADKAWHGDGSNSDLNYGYYSGDIYYPPTQ